jgi:hypothetical protein
MGLGNLRISFDEKGSRALSCVKARDVEAECGLAHALFG